MLKLRVRNPVHYVVGILIAMSCTVAWVLTVTGAAIFIIYELNEDWHLHDRAYCDILEAAIGFFVACAGLIIWRFIA